MPTADPVIAILDDEPQMRTALRRLLTCRGFRVEEYEGAQTFLASVESHPANFLLLDLHMPGINGFDVLEALHAREYSVPVIVITAHDEPGTEDRARALGAVAYLRKPVGRDSLLAAIKAAGDDRNHPTHN